MDITQYQDEYICRVPIPTEQPPFRIVRAGITCSDAAFQTAPGRDGIMMEYICAGTGVMRRGQSEYCPVAGDVCIFTENTDLSCRADAHKPWKRLYIHVEGAAALSLLQAFGLDKTVVYKNCQALYPVFGEIFDALHTQLPADQVAENCSMLIMKLLHRLRLLQQRNPGIPEDVRAVKGFIDNNYRRDLRMEDISASVYRSNDYVKKRFKQFYSVTPYAYYMELKMTYAKHLLQQTNLPVNEIADRLGYKSDRYFSARFRQATGMTATQFRRQKQEEKE